MYRSKWLRLLALIRISLFFVYPFGMCCRLPGVSMMCSDTFPAVF
jgi:hypothetical protein